MGSTHRRNNFDREKAGSSVGEGFGATFMPLDQIIDAREHPGAIHLLCRELTLQPLGIPMWGFC